MGLVASRANALRNMICVNIKDQSGGIPNTPYDTPQRILSLLQGVGITKVRGQAGYLYAPGGGYYINSTWDYLLTNGISINYCVPGIPGDGRLDGHGNPAYTNFTPANIAQALNAYATNPNYTGKIMGIEMPNEIAGTSGVPNPLSLYPSIYETFIADLNAIIASTYPALASIPIICWSMQTANSPPSNVSGINRSCVHTYYGWQPPDFNCFNWNQIAAASDPSAMQWVTETGGSTADGNSQTHSTNETVSAQWLLDIWLDFAQMGYVQYLAQWAPYTTVAPIVEYFFVYELADDDLDSLDDGPDPQKHFGLYSYTTSVVNGQTVVTTALKKGGTAVNKMLAIYQDTDSAADTFPVGTSNASITSYTGDSSPRIHIAQKSINGLPSDFMIAIWGEFDLWNRSSDPGSPITPPPTQDFVLNFGKTYGTVYVYDPMKGETAILTLTNVSSYDSSVTGHFNLYGGPLIFKTVGA